MRNMKQLPLLILLLISPLTFGFTIQWDEPTTSVDGSPLADLSIIQVYQSTQPGIYSTPVASVQASGPTGGQVGIYTAPNPDRGTLYFVVRACDLAGNCSGPSNEVTKVFLDTNAPAAPGNLRFAD